MVILISFSTSNDFLVRLEILLEFTIFFTVYGHDVWNTYLLL